MANAINWGQIYCGSYWSDEDYNTRTLSGSGVPSCFDNAFTYAEAYSIRVEADNGMVEGYVCFENAIDAINYN